MPTPRVLTVFEHEYIRTSTPDDEASLSAGPWLSEIDSEALAELSVSRPGLCQRIYGGVKLAQYCGIVRLPGTIVEILPKIGTAHNCATSESFVARSALLHLLRTAQNVALTEVGDVQQSSVRASLLDIFIAAFLASALRQAHRGLLCRYVARHDDRRVLKGRFNALGHLRRNLTRPHLFACDHDEFTADNDFNRSIRAALNCSRSWCTSPSTQRLWFETNSQFADIESVRMSAAEVARIAQDRITLRYRQVLQWCQRLLSLNSPSTAAGDSEAPGLLFDMNKLFESHVAGIERKTAGDRCIVKTQGPIRSLCIRDASGVFSLKPDITVWSKSADGFPFKVVRVVDAKWKRLNFAAKDWGVDQADVYQLLAYGVSYECSELELVYPQSASEATRSIVFHSSSQAINLRITARTVPVWNS